MKDSELIELRKRLVLGVFIALIVVVPLFFVLLYRFDTKEKIEEEIVIKDTSFVFISSNNCNSCENMKNILKDEKLEYEEISKDDERYQVLEEKLSLSKLNISPPSIIYIYEKEVVGYLSNIKSEKELKEFINNMKVRW